MKVLALTAALLLAASPVAAQTSHIQQPFGAGGQTNNSPLTDTGVICLQEIGCDVLQRDQQPEQLGLRIRYGLQIEHWAWIERRSGVSEGPSLAVVVAPPPSRPGGVSAGQRIVQLTNNKHGAP